MKKAIFSNDHKNIVQRLKQARKESGLDQKEVAVLLNRSQSYLSKLESGQRRIDIVQLKELANIYKKPIDYFIK